MREMRAKKGVRGQGSGARESERACKDRGARIGGFTPGPWPLIPGPLLIALVLSACTGAKGPTPLVVYSPHGRDQLTALEKAFEAQNADIDVRWLDMGSQDAFDRVRSERNNPQGDVW